MESIRAAIFSYILEGRISNLPRINTYWRVAASNSENDFCSVNSTSLALLSRFCHIEVEPKLEEVLNYFLEIGVDSRIVGYLKNFPEDLFPKKWSEQLLEAKANPFPRQWHNLGLLIKKRNTGEQITDLGLIQDLAGACVGSEVASRFVAFCRTSQEIDIHQIILKPDLLKKYAEHKEKISLFYAIVSNLAALWYAKNKHLTGTRVIDIVQKLIDVKMAEFAVVFVMMILKKRSNELIKIPKFDTLVTELGIFFNE